MVIARLSCGFFRCQPGSYLVLSRFIEARLGTDHQRGTGTIPLVLFTLMLERFTPLLCRRLLTNGLCSLILYNSSRRYQRL